MAFSVTTFRISLIRPGNIDHGDGGRQYLGERLCQDNTSGEFDVLHLSSATLTSAAAAVVASAAAIPEGL